MTEAQYDEIHEYLLGRLSPQEQKKVEHQIKTNADYANAVVEERILIHAIQRNNQEETKKRLHLLHQEHLGQSTHSFNRSKMVTVASIILLLGLGGWFFFHKMGQGLPDKTSITAAPIETQLQLTPIKFVAEGGLNHTLDGKSTAQPVFIRIISNKNSIQYRLSNDTLHLEGGNLDTSQIRGIVYYYNPTFVGKYLKIGDDFYRLNENTEFAPLSAEKDETILKLIEKIIFEKS